MELLCFVIHESSRVCANMKRLVCASLVTQSPQRWSGTFARYFDTAPRALAKILASASNCLDAYRHSYISHLLGPWAHFVSDGIE